MLWYGEVALQQHVWQLSCISTGISNKQACGDVICGLPSRDVLILSQGGQAGRGTAQHAELAQQDGNESAFDPSVVAILEEAIALGIVPPFRCGFGRPIKYSMAMHLDTLCVCMHHFWSSFTVTGAKENNQK